MKKRILFVCLGNICRSPSAEAVFKCFVEKEGLANYIKCDSAGTTAFHAGEPADQRMQRHADKRGFDLKSISRGFDAMSDFDEFDLIVGMDDQNIWDLKAKARTDSDNKKICKMTDFAVSMHYDNVPDPYYGGSAGFELVLDILEDSCDGLIQHLKK